MQIKFDDIFEVIGASGPFQVYEFSLISLFASWSYYATAAPFVVFPMDHWCKVPEFENLTWDQQRYVGIPEDADGEYEKCKR
jgi:hypothetical protein